MIIIFIVTFFLIKLFTYKSSSILSGYAKKKSNNIISSIINSSIYNIKDSYEDLIIIEKNSNEEVIDLNFNNIKINNILHLTTSNILNSINELEEDSNMIYYVPLGVIHSLPILINIGPKIPFKIDILGDINNSSDINIKEYGINNVLIEVVLNIKLTIQVILPFVSESVDIDKKIILDSKVLQGNIPNYYGLTKN